MLNLHVKYTAFIYLSSSSFFDQSPRKQSKINNENVKAYCLYLSIIHVVFYLFFSILYFFFLIPACSFIHTFAFQVFDLCAIQSMLCNHLTYSIFSVHNFIWRISSINKFFQMLEHFTTRWLRWSREKIKQHIDIKRIDEKLLLPPLFKLNQKLKHVKMMIMMKHWFWNYECNTVAPAVINLHSMVCGVKRFM